MGFFDFFRKSNNAMPHTSFDYLHESGPTISEASLSDLPRIREAGAFDVVGESYYGQSFTRIASALSLSRGQESDIEVVIAAEPNNRFSTSGKAVAVFVLGHQVGHIPEDYAPSFFDKLETRGGRAVAFGRIWIDDITQDLSRSSVQIYTAIPPQFEDEEIPHGYQISSTYYLKYAAETRKKIDAAFDLRLSTGVGLCPQFGDLKSVFLSLYDHEDRELIRALLGANGLADREIKAKGEGAQLMIIGDDALGESVHTSRALMYDIPILSVSELIATYPQLSPGKETLEARIRFRAWRDANTNKRGLVRLENEEILQSSQEGVYMIPGNCYSGSPSFRIGIFEEDGNHVLSADNGRRKTWEYLGLGQFDSAIFSCRKDTTASEFQFNLQFSGLPIAVTAAENFEYFSFVGDDDVVLVQVNSLGKSNFSVSFELAEWL